MAKNVETLWSHWRYPVTGGTKPFWPAVALAVLIFVAYFPSLGGGRLFDDTSVINLDPNVVTFFGLVPAPQGSVISARPVDRPVTVLSFALITHLFGGPERSMTAHHVLNLLLHIGCAVGLGLLALRFSAMALGRSMSGRETLVVGLATAVFALHPANTQAVAYVSQRAEPLALLFGVLATYFWFAALARAEGRLPRLRVRLFVGALCAAGMLSKPQFVVFPLVLVALDWFYARTERPRLRASWPALASTLIPVIFLLTYPAERSAEIGAGVTSPVTYFFTQMGVLLRYLAILFFVERPTPDPVVEWARGATPALVVGTVLWLAVWGAMVRLWIKPAGRFIDAPPAGIAPAAMSRWGLGALGAWLFIIGLMPTSSFLPIVDPMMVHRIYFPLALALLAWAPALVFAKRKRLPFRVSMILMGCVVVGLVGVTFGYARLWGDQVLMNEYVARMNPKSSRVHRHLGVSYGLTGKYPEAIEAFDRALKLANNSRDKGKALNGKATTLARLGRNAEAATLVEELVHENPNDWYFHQLLGDLYMAWGREAYQGGRVELCHQILDKCDALKLGDGPRKCAEARASVGGKPKPTGSLNNK